MSNSRESGNSNVEPEGLQYSGERVSRLPRYIQPYAALPFSVLILCLGSFINRAGSFAMLFLTIYVSRHLNYGVTFATTCFGVFGVGSVISSVLGGQLADRFGRKPIMLFALFGGASCLILMSSVQSAGGILTLMFLFALTMEMYRPAASAMIGDLVNTDQRPFAFGLMYIAFNLGFAVAAPVGGFLAERSFRWLFLGDAFTTASYAIMIVVLIRETLPGKASTAETADGNPIEHHISWSHAIVHILNDKTFLLFSVAALLTSVVFMQGFSTLPIHLGDQGFSESQIGWLLSSNGILIVVLQIPLTHLLSFANRVIVILIGEVLIAIGFGLTSIAYIGPLVLMTIVIWTIGEVVQAAFKQSMVADLAPVEMRGRYMGVFALSHAIGMTCGVPFGGWVLENFGANVLWPGCFLCAILASCLYAVIYRRTVPLSMDDGVTADLSCASDDG